MTAILALKVLSKHDKKPVNIKPDRFNPAHHTKIPGESPRMIEIDGTPVPEKIIINPVLAAVQAGEHKANVEMEEAQGEIKSKLAEENGLLVEGFSEDEEASEVVEPSPYDVLSDDALKTLAKEKGIKLGPNIGRQKVIEKLMAFDR